MTSHVLRVSLLGGEVLEPREMLLFMLTFPDETCWANASVRRGSKTSGVKSNTPFPATFWQRILTQQVPDYTVTHCTRNFDFSLSHCQQ